MAKIEMYLRPTCPFCVRAKSLLNKKGVLFTEYNINSEPAKRDEMIQRNPNSTTVPQIFVDGKALGGYDDISRLERAGKLDKILGL